MLAMLSPLKDPNSYLNRNLLTAETKVTKSFGIIEHN
uniref:Uncharacterized protein n=1 Tax=Arundo donax TaxID=35708 RepID=A0A0A8YR75_ARUDO